MTKIKLWVAKMNVGTDESFLKMKFNNGEKCGWLKQMRAADEKDDSNKAVATMICKFDLNLPVANHDKSYKLRQFSFSIKVAKK